MNSGPAEGAGTRPPTRAFPGGLLALVLGPMILLAAVRSAAPQWVVLGLVATLALWLLATLGLNAIRGRESGVLAATLKDLAHSRETYSSIVESQTAMVCRYRPDTLELTFVNGAYARRFGLTPEGLVGTSVLRFIPESEHQAVREFVAAIGPDDKPTVIEHLTQTVDGSSTWIRWVDRPVRVQGGRVVEIQAVGYDVSELRDALESVTSSHDRLTQQQAHVSRLSLLVHRLDRRSLAHQVATIAAEEMRATRVAIGEPSDQEGMVTIVADSTWPAPAESRTQLASCHPLITAQLANTSDDSAASAGEGARERQLIEFEEPDEFVLAAPTFAEGRGRGTLVIRRDRRRGKWSAEDRTFAVSLAAILAISLERDRRQALNDELNERTRYLEALNGLIPRLLAQDESALLPADVLRAAAQLIGTEHGYLTLALDDRSTDQVALGLYADSQPATHAALPAADSLAVVPLVAVGAPMGVLGLRFTDGERRFGDLERLVLRQFADLAALVLHRARLHDTLAHELEERSRAEGEVRKLAQELEERVRERTEDLARAHADLRRSETLSAVGALIAGVAHEVRNPLFAMSASLDAFEEEFRGDPQFADYSVHFRREMSRLEALMRQLLDYARPETVELSAHSLPDIVRQSADNCRAAADRLGVSLRTQPGGAANGATADVAPARLQQALQNLIENALQHSPRGSEVSVGLQRSPDGQAWWISIRDHGPGFPSADLPHLFEPFFTRRRGGTGLGLSIAQRIVEQQRGSLELRNQEGGGGEALLVLPVSSAPDARDSLAL